jgi:uridine kinase
MLIESLLSPLGPNGSRLFRRAGFDFLTDSQVDAEWETASEDAILLFDGIFLHRSELRDFWDFSIFVEASFENTVSRAETRDEHLFGDATAVRTRYAKRYVPGQELYLRAVQPASLADVIINNNDLASPILMKVPNPSFEQTVHRQRCACRCPVAQLKR